MSVYSMNDGDWNLILENRGQGCVSIFMPTYRPKGDGRQDPVRLKNLLREAESGLGEAGMTAEEAAAMLAPVHAKNEEERFWKQQKKGLAVFCAPGFFRAYHLPIEFEERVMVKDRFHLRPLMPLRQTEGRFYVLALSLNEVRLLEGERDEVRRIDLDGLVPTSFDDALGYEQYDSVKQVHSTSSKRLAQPGMVHGHGDNDQEKLKKDVHHYFQLVAKGLTKVMRDKGAPLVLATVQQHVPLFRDANKHPLLLDAAIPGNPEGLADHELYKRAWAIVEPWLESRSDEVIERYTELKATGRVSSKVEEVVRAADEGRVEVLMVAQEPLLWGRYDRDRAAVTLHQTPQNGDEDLLDRAAFETLARGGTVLSLPSERIPDGAAAAAVYRY